MDQVISNEARKDARGTTQAGVRLYNERLILSLIRRHGALPKAELARLTGLSAQTVSVIVRQLEQDALLIKGEPQRGKVGQPLVPFTLNPDGAYSMGLKVGRRSSELVLLDMAGEVRDRARQTYRIPEPALVLGFAKEAIALLTKRLKPSQRKSVAGLGIAAPFELWNWQEEQRAPPGALDGWKEIDLVARVAAMTKIPVFDCNDATAACAAELLFGKGRIYKNFSYLFVGYFIGGGTVIGGSVFPGRSGYSGAYGPLPIMGSNGKLEQLIRHASVYALEKDLVGQGQDPMLLADSPSDWSGAEPALSHWIASTASSLAQAVVATMSVVEFDAIIIDGALPDDVRQELLAETRKQLGTLDLRGLPDFAIEEGSMGRDARARGAAALPLFAHFMIDRDVLFKEPI
ncbi:ROK family transcriptional regulator [Aestuariivirga litoralis]|uniref:ROK family transcriptional regulator n=1 Tax=Aestuariivirga litoralis TaxID=2650924 RepID=UPI0018C85C38|nr:ROK family transcriptional regulator [Aestuariivirga litoralis]MBG1233806.1 ROK family transcriptional regulator [Aestuariivirga litoralis]